MLKPMLASVGEALTPAFDLHRLDAATDRDAFLAEVGPRIRGLAVNAQAVVDGPLLDRLPNLEIVANFGVGYDTIDAAEAGVMAMPCRRAAAA
ncbi:MAG: hypothetical protein EOO66_23325 [Methylobacterium sp.]|nr:MAG: hypothetical protein EOO66_23325 [Methylobacterium sp.]